MVTAVLQTMEVTPSREETAQRTEDSEYFVGASCKADRFSGYLNRGTRPKWKCGRRTRNRVCKDRYLKKACSDFPTPSLLAHSTPQLGENVFIRFLAVLFANSFHGRALRFLPMHVVRGCFYIQNKYPASCLRFFFFEFQNELFNVCCLL